MSAAPVLVTLMGGRVVGHVEQNLQGKLRFTYDQVWRDWPGAYPLSLSMPMGRREHEDQTIRPYLEGLLPDNEWILRRWGSQFHVSARNPFTLLAHVGEDCAGAVQFCRPDRVAELQGNADPPVRWLAEAEIATTLRELRTDNATGRVAADPGYFSLPGAQPKTALLFQDGRWGIPSGRTPTTHILKPPLGDLEGFAENEHLCLRLAAGLGLPVARSEVRRFDGEIAIVVERYDRMAVGGRIVRVHQEDFCQALSVPPRIKYEAEGGPGAPAMATVLRDFSSAPEEDLDTLLTALALNWVIGGTDAHAKNFSLLIAARQVRLAPLYDIASVLPYPPHSAAEGKPRPPRGWRVSAGQDRPQELGAPGKGDGVGRGRGGARARRRSGRARSHGAGLCGSARRRDRPPRRGRARGDRQPAGGNVPGGPGSAFPRLTRPYATRRVARIGVSEANPFTHRSLSTSMRRNPRGGAGFI